MSGDGRRADKCQVMEEGLIRKGYKEGVVSSWVDGVRSDQADRAGKGMGTWMSKHWGTNGHHGGNWAIWLHRSAEPG